MKSHPIHRHQLLSPCFPAEAGSSEDIPLLVPSPSPGRGILNTARLHKASSGIMVTFRLIASRKLRWMAIASASPSIPPACPFNTMVPQPNSANISSQKGFWGHFPDYRRRYPQDQGFSRAAGTNPMPIPCSAAVLARSRSSLSQGARQSSRDKQGIERIPEIPVSRNQDHIREVHCERAGCPKSQVLPVRCSVQGRSEMIQLPSRSPAVVLPCHPPLTTHFYGAFLQESPCLFNMEDSEGVPLRASSAFPGSFLPYHRLHPCDG